MLLLQQERVQKTDNRSEVKSNNNVVKLIRKAENSVISAEEGNRRFQE
jgi:hypothetical protein